MGNSCSDFLHMSINCSSKSPVKTSTVIKEDIKWNEDEFFKRKQHAQGSESLFLPNTDTSISVLNEVTNMANQSVFKSKFPLNNSVVSEGANSSLGILHIENLSGLSNGVFSSAKREKSVRNSASSSEEQFSKEMPDCSTVIKSQESDLRCSMNSPDIEYDGTNIPELNPEFDVLSLISSNKAISDQRDNLSNISESKFNNILETPVSYADCSGYTTSDQQFTKDYEECLKSNLASKENSINSRKSIFENFEASYDSLFHNQSINKNNIQMPKTIKVCPFVDVSSFEIEAMPNQQNYAVFSPDIENIRCSQNDSLNFHPEHISARSSSFNSSLKSGLTTSATSNISKKKFNPVIPFDATRSCEDLENEVLSGSCHFTSESLDVKSSQDFNSHIDLEQLSNLTTEGENWSSRLGISESEFFSSDAVKELLKKDSEAFKKENMFEVTNTSKISNGTDWSPLNQLEVTAPSWFSDLSPTNEQNFSRHISIGKFINARSEQLGTLSEDSRRERPSFGTTTKTPTQNQPPIYRSTTTLESKEKISEDSMFNFKQLRFSALSEILDETSSLDPINLATKISNKYMEHPHIDFQTSKTSVANIEQGDKSFKYASNIQEEVPENTSRNTENLQSTLIQSSTGSVNKFSDFECLDIKSDKTESVQSLTNSLNFSNVDANCGRESNKTDKSDVCSSCNLSIPQQNIQHGFSRPPSSCCSSHHDQLPMQNTLALQYGHIKYMNTGQEHSQCTNPNHYLMLQNGSCILPCSHTCVQHTMQSNVLSLNTANSFQPIQNTLAGTSLPMLSCSNLGIEVPKELCFPEKIALGDSQEMNLTIRNSSALVNCYNISCVSAYLNDSPLPLEMSGISYNKTLPCNMGNTNDLKLILAPKYEGKFEINLQIDAVPNSINPLINSLTGISARTKIIYEVKQPIISLHSKHEHSLNVGPIISGSTFVEYVTLINKSEVSVPLRISLSNNSSGNQIYFGMKELDRQKFSTLKGLKFLSPTVIFYRLPGSRIESQPSSVNIPIVFESIDGQTNATLTAAIETPTLSEILAFINIFVSAVKAKLALEDVTQNPIQLKAAIGSTCSHNIAVINDGTFNIVYNLQIESEIDCFSVMPNSLKLEPKQTAVISVSYSPLVSEPVKGSLLAATEQYSQVCTVAEIFGNVTTNVDTSYYKNLKMQSVQPTRESVATTFESQHLIECNKKYLAWGGTNVGQNIIKSFIIRNPGQDMVHVKLFIKDKYQAFQLVNNFSHQTLCYKFSLKGKEERDISVSFNPKDVAFYSGLLCVKPLTSNERTVFSIPLTGYGGIAKIKILDLPNMEGSGYCLNIDNLSDTNIVYKNILLQNIGFRAAFVKILVTHDNFAQISLKQTIINPSEFVLLPNEKKNILLSASYVNTNYMRNTEIILILYGDEIMRQALRKYAKSAFVSCNFDNVNFNTPYDGEDKVSYDSPHVFSPKSDSLFYANLKKLMIHVFFNGQNTSFNQRNFTALSVIQESFENLTLDSSSLTRCLNIEGHSPPVKESVMKNASRLSLPLPFEDNHLQKVVTSGIADKFQSLNLNSWSISPEELVLNAESKDKRILLKSFSNIDMRFRVECAIDVISVSPLSGLLSANGSIGLRLTLINYHHNKLFDDYQGLIKVSCDGLEKTAIVKVIKDQKKVKNVNTLKQSAYALNSSVKSGFLCDAFMDTTLITKEHATNIITIENILNFPKLIDLPQVKPGFLTELKVITGNLSKNDVIWSIQPLSELFTEPCENLTDCTSLAIDILPFNGILKSMEKVTIVIKFTPTYLSQFFQFFKLSLCGNSETEIYNFKVQGKSVADSTNYESIELPDCTDNKQKSTSKKKIKREIFIDNDVCEFAAVALGQKSSSEITIKNVSNTDFKLNIIKPHLPFIIKHSSLTVKSGKFLKIPIYFKPFKQVPVYESEVKFVTENGLELKVKLKGYCSK